MRNQVLFLAIFSLGWMVSASDLAHAYIDPGIGSVLFQALAAVLVGVGAVWYAFRQKIASVFQKNPKDTASSEKDRVA